MSQSGVPLIRAISTFYNGCLFRSRLEARWAVFFDRMGLKWTYEPEGFTDGRTRYLPDFQIVDAGTFIEIKPESFEFDRDLVQQKKIAMLINGAANADEGAQILLVCGDP